MSIKLIVNFQQMNIHFQEDCYLIEYLLRFLSKLQPISDEEQNNLLKRLLAALSKHLVQIDNNLIPSGNMILFINKTISFCNLIVCFYISNTDKGFKRIGEGTYGCSMKFLRTLFELIEQHHSQRNLFNVDDKQFDNEYDVESFQELKLSP